jgi:hypothetical protein
MATTHDTMLSSRLRGFAAVVTVLAIAIAGFGLLPGERVHHQVHPCAGEFVVKALSALSHESYQNRSEADCKPQDTGEVDEHPAAGNEVIIPLLLIVFAPALWVYRRPSQGLGWVWFGWSLFAGLGSLAVAFVLGIGRAIFEYQRTETLWPSYIVSWGIGVLAVTFTLVLPVMLIITPKPPRPPVVPKAIVVE